MPLPLAECSGSQGPIAAARSNRSLSNAGTTFFPGVGHRRVHHCCYSGLLAVAKGDGVRAVGRLLAPDTDGRTANGDVVEKRLQVDVVLSTVLISLQRVCSPLGNSPQDKPTGKDWAG